MLSYRQALILGVLQGISELFPISSLGHSILLPALLGWLLAVGTVPAGALGFAFEKQLREFFVSPSYVASFLVLNGLLLYIAELLRTRAKSGIAFKDTDQRIAAAV